jgi:hypothetical protein
MNRGDQHMSITESYTRFVVENGDYDVIINGDISLAELMQDGYLWNEFIASLNVTKAEKIRAYRAERDASRLSQ